MLAIRDGNLFLCLNSVHGDVQTARFSRGGSVRRTLVGVALKITKGYVVRTARGSK